MDTSAHRPLNILIANSGRKWIGEVAHCVMLRRELIRRGHRVWLACREGFALHEHAAAEGMECLPLRFSGKFHPWADARDAARLNSLVRGERIDVLHAHRGKDHWLALAASAGTGIPLVRTRHVVTKVKPHLFNRLLHTRGTDAVLAVSEAAAASFGPLRSALPGLRILLSAVDSERFQPSRRSEAWRKEGLAPDAPEPFWIGLIGRMQTIKGQEVFLRAAEAVSRELPEARFLLAGRGKRRRRYGRLAESLGIRGRVRIEGWLENVETVAASLDIGVVASLGSEGSSRAGLEYMASGTPVVASRVGGLPDILEPPGEEPCGRLVPPGDPAALAEALLRLARDPAARSAMAARARETALRRHDPDRWAAAVESVYYEAIDRRAGRLKEALE